jgi:uncharacterized protein involved in outer membrane biogenesis
MAIDAAWHGDRVEARQVTLDVTDEAKRTLASVATVRPLTFDLKSLQVEGAASSEVELVRMKLSNIPLGAFVRFTPGWSFSGSLAHGDVTLAANAEKLILRANAPLSLADFSLVHGSQALLSKTRLQASPRLELAHGALNQISSGEVTLSESTGASMGKLTIDLTQEDAGHASGAATFNIDFPGLANQPLWAKAEPLSAGRASGEVRFASVAGGFQFEARATLNGLVTRDSNQTLPVANLGLRMVAQPDGKLSLQAPILIDQAGNRSDLNLGAEGMRRSDGGLELAGRLTGEHVELADAQLLASIFGAPLGGSDPESSAAQSRALSPPSADAKPFWAGVEGKFALDVKSVTQGKDWTMSGLGGELVVTPQRIELSKLGANFSEKSRFAAQGTIEFDAGIDPYHLTGDFSLTEFDVGRLFKAFDETRAPTLEGLFNVQGKFEGRGLTFEDVLDHTRGQFELSGKQGVFRGLKRATDKISLASKAVGMIGSLLGDKSADKIANAGYYTDQLAQSLAELPYDQFRVKLVRDDALNLQIKELLLLSPEVHFLGKGQISYQAGKRLYEQPLSAVLTLRARGRVEESLGKLRVLDGTRDELDYANCKESVNIGGTLARPDPTPFFLKLAAQKLSEMLAPEN